MIQRFSWAPRDRRTLVGVGIGIVMLLLVGGSLIAGTMVRRLDRTIATRTQALHDIGQLRGEALALQQRIRQEEAKLAQSGEGSLTTTVEGLANRVGGQGNLAYLRPTATSAQDGLQVETMELKLERQSLEQVLQLLWGVENSAAAPMAITSLRLQRRFDNHALLDTTVGINAYRK